MKTRRSTPRFSSKNISLFFAALMLMISVGAAAQKPNDPPGNPNPPGQEEHTQLQATVDQMTIDLEQIKADMELLLAASNAGGSGGGSWDQVLDSTNGDPDGCNSDRFTCVMEVDGNFEAVRDNETGLVWERSPSIVQRPVKKAFDHCVQQSPQTGTPSDPTGGRFGWHLPSIEQLASLVDRTVEKPSLPPNHPFLNIVVVWPGPGTSTDYFATTTEFDGRPVATHGYSNPWAVQFTQGLVGTLGGRGYLGLAWCVRGGTLSDGNQPFVP